jgi:ferrochelatase
MSDERHPPPGHPTIPPRRIGVLLVNLGTPDATD